MIVNLMLYWILFRLSFQMWVDKEVFWSLLFLSDGGLKGLSRSFVKLQW